MPTLGAETKTTSVIPPGSLRLTNSGKFELAGAMVTALSKPLDPKNLALRPKSGSAMKKETFVGNGARNDNRIPQRPHPSRLPLASNFASMILFGVLGVEVAGTATIAKTNPATESPGLNESEGSDETPGPTGAVLDRTTPRLAYSVDRLVLWLSSSNVICKYIALI
jgi:hypothetical protein